MFSAGTFRANHFAANTFIGTVVAVPVVTPTSSLVVGYVREQRRRRKKRETVVEVAVLPSQEIKYVQITRTTEPSMAPIMESVEKLLELFERNSMRSAIVKRKIEEMQEEEDIIVILSLMQ